MADKLSAIRSPEYEALLPVWEEYRRLVCGGNLLYDALPQEDNEDNEAWKRRRAHCVDLVAWSKTLQKQIDILALAGIVMRTDDPRLGAVVAGDGAPGVDGCGSSMLSFMLDKVLRSALAYQRAFVVVDRAAGVSSEMSQADAEALPMPYAYVLEPDKVPAVTYANSASKEIVHAITVSSVPVRFWSNGMPREYAPVWIEWRPDGIRVEDENGTLVRESVNKLGVVPILEFSLNDSLLRDMYRLTMEIMNHYSLAGSGAAQQVYGLPVVCSDKAMDKVNMTQGLMLGKGDTFQLHQSPVDGLKFNVEMVNKLQEQVDKVLTGRIYSMSVTALQQSGASKRMDNICQENFSAYLADNLLRFAPQLTNLMGAYIGQPEVEMDLSAPDQFVSQDRDSDRQDATYFSTQYQAETTRQWIAQQQRIRVLSGLESNMTAEEVAEDNEELEAKAERLFTTQPIADGMMTVEEDAGDGEESMDDEDTTDAGDGDGAGTGEQVEGKT